MKKEFTTNDLDFDTYIPPVRLKRINFFGDGCMIALCDKDGEPTATAMTDEIINALKELHKLYKKGKAEPFICLNVEDYIDDEAVKSILLYTIHINSNTKALYRKLKSLNMDDIAEKYKKNVSSDVINNVIGQCGFSGFVMVASQMVFHVTHSNHTTETFFSDFERSIRKNPLFHEMRYGELGNKMRMVRMEWLKKLINKIEKASQKAKGDVQ